MKKTLLFVFITAACSIVCAADFSVSSGQLRMTINSTGEVTELTNLADGKNYVAARKSKNWKSYLIMCSKYGGKELPPSTMSVLKETKNGALLQFKYSNNTELKVNVQNKGDYIRMELVDAQPLKEINKIVWGPYKTTMNGPVAIWLGFNRSDDFTVGCLSLEPNTDGKHKYAPVSANYDIYGSFIALYSLDHTRPVQFKPYRFSTPINVTVKGSAVALFGVPRGRKSELDMIEKIELAENLPHPTYLGKWNKRTPSVQKISLWLGLDHNNKEKCMNIAREMSAGTICRMHGYFSNWGHFDIDKKVFPGGTEEIATYNKKLWEDAHVKDTTYTLSGFLKPMSGPEPWISPIPDPRLAKFDPVSSVSADFAKEAKTFRIKNIKGYLRIFKGKSVKVLCVGNEMIEFKTMKQDGNDLVIGGAQRGAFKSAAVDHKKNEKVRYMFVKGYHNFYPGTVEMNNEMAANIGRSAQACGSGVVILDGYESCFETGHTEYALNTFAKTIYDLGGAKDRLMSYSLTLGNYNWHMMSYQSWGEYQLERGFRGTMLDYRIGKQILLHNNLVPNKMGQYYPTDATLEDIEWLMARACGWDAGVDLNIKVNKITKNPEYKAMCNALRLWEKARMDKVFTEKQKMFLRQTDRLYHLSEDKNGKLQLKFVKFWQHKGVKISPPSVFDVKSVKNATVKPLSVKWFWTHNPAIFAECGLSDDLVYTTSSQGSAEWSVKLPASPNNKIPEQEHLLPLLRLSANAPCGVTDICIKANGNELKLPVTLNPGEYLSIPHDTKLGCIYDSKTHDIKREFYVPQFNSCWYLPNLKRGKVNKIELSCKPIKKGADVKVLLNLRYWNDILKKKK